jgi:hypothetical protein
MDRPRFTRLDPTYYRGVCCIMDILENFNVTPDSTKVRFGNLGDQEPNYQVTCEGRPRPFVFRVRGAMHLPFDGPGQDLMPFHPNQFREGRFRERNLDPGEWPHAAIRQYAIEDTPRDDDGGFEHNAERRYWTRQQAQRDRNFRDRLLKEQGEPNHCAVCDMDVVDCLQGAHVHEVQHRGLDLVSNGIILCASHHLLFDKHRFGIDPVLRTIVVSRTCDWSRERMWITRDKITEAVGETELQERWQRFLHQTEG